MNSKCFPSGSIIFFYRNQYHRVVKTVRHTWFSVIESKSANVMQFQTFEKVKKMQFLDGDKRITTNTYTNMPSKCGRRYSFHYLCVLFIIYTQLLNVLHANHTISHDRNSFDQNIRPIFRSVCGFFESQIPHSGKYHFQLQFQLN